LNLFINFLIQLNPNHTLENNYHDFLFIVCECDILKEYKDTVSVNGSKFLERKTNTIVFIGNIKEDIDY